MNKITMMAALAMFGLAACGESGGGVAKADGAAGNRPTQTVSSGVTAPAPVIEAIRCWGLTHGASVFHSAAPEQAGDLPAVTIEEYTAWFNEALRRSAKAGLNQAQFQALQTEYQMSNRFVVKAELRAASVDAIKACLAKTPADMSEPPQLPEA